MAFHLHGTHVPHRKNTANMQPQRMPLPKAVRIPVAMHIGKPAVPKVAKGDHVDVGTLIAEQDGLISAPIYSSVSGMVTSIEEKLLSNGGLASVIVIETDGEQTVDANLNAPVIESKEDLIEAIKNSGMVGLGGAGFPTYVKFMTDKEIDTLVLNGAECEPYITSDSITMVNNADDIFSALELLDKYFDFKQIVIGIEKNKPEAIAAMKALEAKNTKIKVKVLPSIYPQGGEKVLVYHTIGRVMGEGVLPADVGCIVCNTSTIANLGKYFATGMPLVERTITVDGGAVKEPKNVIAVIGTSLKEIFEFCGGFKVDPKKVIYGGPMMGVAVPNLEEAVLKQTNALLALTDKECEMPKETACIRCGACLNTCPFGIDVPSISRGYSLGDMEMVKKAGVAVCMECGCCSFVCPANRPLVQTNKLAKTALADYKKKEANK